MRTHQSSDPTLAHPAANLLGEGPVWHSERNSLFWVDIEARQLLELRWPERRSQVWNLPERIGAVVAESGDTVIAALQNGIVRLHLDTGGLQHLYDLECEIAENRANDGKCDPQGRLWQGTMELNCASGAGALYCIEANGKVQKALSGLGISNGMAWSLDGRRFYFIDSPTYKVVCYHFESETGALVFEKDAVVIPPELGMPDGMTIDREGMLWVAHWDGFAVRRWNPRTGDLLDTILLPAPQITSCAFGGVDLDELFITSARTGMSEAQLEQYPESGHLFVVKLPVGGLPASAFKSIKNE
jgi:sugar lactone lactonase YvrE